ncbi:MAG: DNA-3-methyladenine glycosylase [Candidatus Nanohaloarchaea archaeon]
MRKLEIPTQNFDLKETLTCGQTFNWNRLKGELYGEGSNKFYTFRNGKPLIAHQQKQTLFVETELSRAEVEKALGLDHSLEQVFSRFPEDKKLEKAYQEFQGLRIVQDEFFPTLISYLLSPQMRIPRIKQTRDRIAEKYGETVEHNGYELKRFPTQEQLAKVSEQEFRDLGAGYRAKYIAETMKILENSFKTEQLDSLSYSEAKQRLKQLYGVGDKVADCVLLFSLGFHEATPLDTWAKKALKQHYPQLHSDDYAETVENLQNRFGEKAGYAVEYLFHAARQDVLETG